MHSRVARSNAHLLTTMGANVRFIAPKTLVPLGVEDLGVTVYDDLSAGIEGCNVIMMLRLQLERMTGSFLPSTREYFYYYGLDHEKLKLAAPDAVVMHPGPMNRGVEIDSAVADDRQLSVIQEQVEMGGCRSHGGVDGPKPPVDRTRCVKKGEGTRAMREVL